MTMKILEDYIVFDIETDTHGNTPDPEKDKLVYVGFKYKNIR